MPGVEFDAPDEPEKRLVGSDRVLAVLIELAKYPDGIGLDEMAEVVDSPEANSSSSAGIAAPSWGINCLAVPAFMNSPTVPSGAISISALAYRVPVQQLVDDLPAIRQIVGSPADGHVVPSVQVGALPHRG